jgi:hypothetical protein
MATHRPPPAAVSALRSAVRHRRGVRLGGGLVRRGVRGRRDVPPDGGQRQVQGGVLLEDRQLKLLQLRTRLDRQFLDQQ